MSRNNLPFVPYRSSASATANNPPLPMPDQQPNLVANYSSPQGGIYHGPAAGQPWDSRISINDASYIGSPRNSAGTGGASSVGGFRTNVGLRDNGPSQSSAPTGGQYTPYSEPGGYNDSSGVYWPNTTTTTQPGWGSNLFNSILRNGLGVVGSVAGGLAGPAGSLAGGVAGKMLGNKLFHGGPTTTEQFGGPPPATPITQSLFGFNSPLWQNQATPNVAQTGAPIPTNGSDWSYGGVGAPVGSIVGSRGGRPVIQGPNGPMTPGQYTPPPAPSGHFGTYYGGNGFTNELRAPLTSNQQSQLITSFNDQVAASGHGALRLPDERGTFSPGVLQTGTSGYLGNDPVAGNTVGSWANQISPEASAQWQQEHAAQIAHAGRFHSPFRPPVNPTDPVATAGAGGIAPSLLGPPITQPPNLGDSPKLSATGIPIIPVNGNPTFQGPLQTPQIGAVGPNGQPINPVFQGPVQTPSQQYQAAMARMQAGGSQ